MTPNRATTEAAVSPRRALSGSGRRRSVGYVRRLDQVEQLSTAERRALEVVTARYVFRANGYFLGLIDWDDPDDPIRRLVIPQAEELAPWGTLDASNERAITVARGVQHKYADTVLLLCNEVCGAYCRYCFRKRLFMDDNDEVSNDVSEGLAYVARHPEVSNVLLTGGDPLLMSTRRISELLAALAAIPHVKIVRLGSKMPAFDPWRLLDDPALLAAFRQFSTAGRRLYLMAHFDHPRELTRAAVRGLEAARDAGMMAVNQCPLIRGINDSPTVLAELFGRLAVAGAPQYYLFQGRPTEGNAPFEVPIVRSYFLLQEALERCSGLARRVRYCLSHDTGKVEVLAIDARHIYFKYHRAREAHNRGRFFACERDDQASWLGDLRPVAHLGEPPPDDVFAS